MQHVSPGERNEFLQKMADRLCDNARMARTPEAAARLRSQANALRDAGFEGVMRPNNPTPWWKRAFW